MSTHREVGRVGIETGCRLSCTIVLFASAARAQGPTTYCTAGMSTHGCTPSISANVQPNISNSAGCVITTSGVEGQKQGLIFYGVDNSGFAPASWGAGSTSFRCVKSPTRRIGAPMGSGGTLAQCDGVFVINWDAFQLAHPTSLGNPWMVGDKVFAQAWYRDPPAVRTSNLSNAVELTLIASPPSPCVTPIDGMVLIPAGTFLMGSAAPGGPPYWNSANEQPVHSVTISYCFWMGVTEVTQAQYGSLMGANPSQHQSPTVPVNMVNWHMARAYCAALTAQQSALGQVPAGWEYRLPTEAEWEYACRAGTTTEYNVGQELFCSQAKFGSSLHTNTSCNSGAPIPVASYPANAWGLHDMHGNIWEWCLDSFASYSSGVVTNPFVTGGATRVIRGGFWSAESYFCRSPRRNTMNPNFSFAYTGFRVVLGPEFTP